MRDLTSQLRRLGDHERQATRLLRLRFPRGDGPEALLLPQRLDAEEALGRDFVFRVDLLSDTPDIPLKDVLGRMVTVTLVRADGSQRHFNGYAFEFAFVEHDAGYAVYRLELRPWLAFLRLRRDSWLFHGCSVEQQTEQIFADHDLRDWRCVSLGADPPMTDACQYDETDYNYLHRRWESLGWHYGYEHREDGHTLVLCGDSHAWRPIDGGERVEWQGDSGVVRSGLHRFGAVRAAAASHYCVGSFDFKRPRPTWISVPTLNRQGRVPALEVYETLGAYGHPDAAAGDALGKRRIEALEAAAKHFEGEGNEDRLECGRRFVLAGHEGWAQLAEEPGDNEFIVVEARHLATNNHDKSGEVTASEYRGSVVCIRRRVPWRPLPGHNSVATRIDAPQTAIVVGPPGQDVHTDDYGRVRVQFHWDREGRLDEGSSAWLRVASPWAGGRNGFIGVPRIGSEVVVQWLGGHPDRPVITGGLHNTERMPPWRLPGELALSGMRSRELGSARGNDPGGRSNHLVLDDTPGRIQAQLRSDHEASQLSLGAIGRIEDHAGRKEARGDGFELRTDAHGAVRAQQGLLVTTEGRPRAQAHMTDLPELADALKRAAALQDDLADAALQARAQERDDQDAVARALDEQVTSLRGATVPGRERFPEFQQPHLAIASAAALQTHARTTTHMASDAHHAVTSGGHTSFAAGRSLIASARDAIRLFAARAGLRLVAAASDIDIAALAQSVRILAKLEIRQTAGRITLAAQEEVVINGGGSYTRWSSAGIVSGTNGAWRAKAAAHRFDGPDNAPVPPLEPVEVKLKETPPEGRIVFSLQQVPGPSPTLAGQPCTLLKDGAELRHELLDDFGRLVIEPVEPGCRYQVRLFNGELHDVDVLRGELAADPSSRDYDEHQGSNRGYRADGLDAAKRRSQRERACAGPATEV